jgi:hypothetical protein
MPAKQVKREDARADDVRETIEWIVRNEGRFRFRSDQIRL